MSYVRRKKQDKKEYKQVCYKVDSQLLNEYRKVCKEKNINQVATFEQMMKNIIEELKK